MTSQRNEAINQAIDEIHELLELTPDGVLNRSQQQDPQKANGSHFPPEGRELLLKEVEVTWFLMREMLKVDEYEGVFKSMRTCMDRLVALELIFCGCDTIEKDSLAHIATAILGNLSFLQEDLA